MSYSDYILCIPNFLSNIEYNKLINIIQNNNNIKYNNNGLLTKTLNDSVNDIFYSKNKLNNISNILGNIVYKSNIPCEYRTYNISNSMKWHKDIQLYEKPQYECVYTISNNSDSTTDYVDQWGFKRKLWTEPNSLIIFKSNGFYHGVNPVTKGKREIIKLIYTQTDKINYKNKIQYLHALNGNT